MRASDAARFALASLLDPRKETIETSKRKKGMNQMKRKDKKEDRVTIELKINLPDSEVHDLLMYLIDKTWENKWSLEDFNYPEMGVSRTKKLMRALELRAYKSLRGMHYKL